MSKADVEFRNTVSGCGTHVIIEISPDDIQQLKDVLSSPGLDIEVTAVAYPYMTTEDVTTERVTNDGHSES